MTTCDNCGKKLDVMDGDSLYCPYCGASYDPVVQIPNDEPSPAELLAEEMIDRMRTDRDDREMKGYQR